MNGQGDSTCCFRFLGCHIDEEMIEKFNMRVIIQTYKSEVCGGNVIKLKLVKASNEYCNQIRDMLDEWNASGEKSFHMQSAAWTIMILNTIATILK